MEVEARQDVGNEGVGEHLGTEEERAGRRREDPVPAVQAADLGDRDVDGEGIHEGELQDDGEDAWQ